MQWLSILILLIFLFQVNKKVDLQFVNNWVKLILIEKKIIWNQFLESEKNWNNDSKLIVKYFCDKYFEKPEMCLVFGMLDTNSWTAINTAIQNDQNILGEMKLITLNPLSAFTIENINSYRILGNIFKICLTSEKIVAEIDNTKNVKQCYSVRVKNGSIKVVDFIN